MANVYNNQYIIMSGGEIPVDNGPIYEGKYRVRYFDTDGTILKIEYVESGGKTTPPDNPSYDPDYLIFDEWNYDVANYIVEQPTDIGAIYDTVDDATYLFCRFTTNTGLNPTLAISGATSIDWGDGTVDTSTSHTYANEGEYIIKIYGDISFNTSSKELFGNSIINKALQKCYIKNGVTSLSEKAINHCHSLTIISIPKSVENIGNFAFSNCHSLKSTIIPEGVTSIGTYAFSNCYSIESISIPNNVTSIGAYAIYTCYSLKSITIPESVTSIGKSAFSNSTSLRSISISKNVTSIGTNAFSYCYGVTDYFIGCDTVPTLSSTNAFASINQSAIMWVNNSIVDLLNVATNWSTYASYMKPRSWYPSLTDPNA